MATQKHVIDSRTRPAGPRPAQPLVVFSFDDAPYTDKSVVMPILTEKAIKGTFCIKTNSVVTGTSGTSLTWQDLRDWQAAGHELNSHTVTHANLTTEVTTAQLEAELVDSKAAMIAQGLDVVGFCYPYSANNAAVRERVRAHYEYALGGAGSTIQPLGTYAITRYGIGSASVAATVKARVDTAIAAGEVLIFLIHSSYDLDAAGQTMLRDVIDYVKASSAKIVTAREAFRLAGNIVDVGDYPGGVDYTVIGGNGKLKASEAGNVIKRNTNTVKITDAPNVFIDGKIYYDTVNTQAGGNDAGQWPYASPGNVITNKMEPAYNSWVFQQFIPTAAPTGLVYTRRATSTTTWGAWVSNAGASTHTVYTAMDATSVTKPLTDFPLGTSLQVVPNPGSTGPGGVPGVLRTFRATEAMTYPSYSWQQWDSYQSTASFKRYALTSSTWSAWEGIVSNFPTRQNTQDAAACAKMFTDYVVGITYEIVPAPTSGGAPGGGVPGVLKTVKMTTDTAYPGYSYQEYHVHGNTDTTDTYKRNAASATTWTAWKKFTLV
jgi:peptidoglycan/xylan/chitin deacetylase (PgdA/CDA1 family)